MFKQALNELLLGKDLNEHMATEAITALLKGEVDEIGQAAFLTALKAKGEKICELLCFARTMRSFATKVDNLGFDVIDLAGTGGDGKATFNISTAVAFVIAALGVKVAKHGNHGVSGPVGSADVLASLGICYDVDKDLAAQSLKENGIMFLYAPKFQKATANVAKVRRALGFRTIFNLLGPLTNPSAPTSQLMGIYDFSMASAVAEVLNALGTKKALIVRSFDGMDELSCIMPSNVCQLDNGKITEYTIDPKELGFSQQSGSYIVGSAKQSAEIICDVLKGFQGIARDMVLINSAAALYAYGACRDIKEGVILAKKSIDSGLALQKLQDMQQWSKKVLAQSSTMVS